MRATAFTAFLCLLLLTGCAHARDGWVELAGKRYTVELATNDAQRERGLMFRQRMDADRGMLFVHEREEPLAYWMKNTLIPLDIIFVRSDGTIVRIANAKALDETPVPAGEPIALVLEIHGGRAAELGIKAGDRVDWPH
jgi:uncharacterized protein